MLNTISDRFMNAAPYKQRRIVFGVCLLFWVAVAASIFFSYN